MFLMSILIISLNKITCKNILNYPNFLLIVCYIYVKSAIIIYFM